MGFESYKGSIKMASGMKPEADGYPLMQACDIQVDEEGTRLDEKLLQLGDATPTFNLAKLGLSNVLLDGTQALLETDTTEIMTALNKGVVKFSFNVETETDVCSCSMTPTVTGVGGERLCTAIVEIDGAKMLCIICVQKGSITAWFSLFDKSPKIVPISQEAYDELKATGLIEKNTLYLIVKEDSV